MDCKHNGLGVLSFCDHSETGGVVCSREPAENCSNGDVHLKGGRDKYEGRVEMCYRNRWGTVCHDNWGNKDAVVVCNQLGYSGILQATRVGSMHDIGAYKPIRKDLGAYQWTVLTKQQSGRGF